MHAVIVLLTSVILAGGHSSPNGAKPVRKIGDTVKLQPLDVFERPGQYTRITRVPDIGTAVINGAKKAERVYVADVPSVLATNTARQAFSSVAGINVWESDPAGLQLSIGARGLSPNRMVNFNARQNGYDISADPLGYPEAYYTPLLQAVDHIDVVRGAGSLRYGSQFGGTVNFIMKEGSRKAPLEGLVTLTGGSYGFASGYAEVGGTSGSTNYIGIYQYRQADAWRVNSQFHQHFGYAAVSHRFTPALQVKIDATKMTYLSHQPAGLTDSAFAVNPRSSTRNRNWFESDWNMASATLDWQLASRTRLRSVTFVNSSARVSVGNVSRINLLDNGGARTVIDDAYDNIGNETTVRHDDSLLGMSYSVLGGLRYYQGTSVRKQGLGTAGTDADFSLVNNIQADGFNFTHPNANTAAFAEILLNVTPNFKVVPGIRYDMISTAANGTFNQRGTDSTGATVWSYPTVREERNRNVLLAGVGVSYTLPESTTEFYANATQNYRAVNFSDLRITSPTLVVDPNIRDASGYTLDLGVRGSYSSIVNWDISLFSIEFRDRIGEVVLQNSQGTNYRLRTNLSNAYSRGVEWMTETQIHRLLGFSDDAPTLSWLLNATMLESRYRSVSIPAIDQKKLEYAPDLNIRTGITTTWENLRGSVLVTHVSKQYADAANVEFDAAAASGVIPAYTVVDLMVGYSFDRYRLDLGVNNLLDAMYFTRRSDGYPGPGILPAEPRTFNASISVTL